MRIVRQEAPHIVILVRLAARTGQREPALMVLGQACRDDRCGHDVSERLFAGDRPEVHEAIEE
jgi:hypothetical protein